MADICRHEGKNVLLVEGKADCHVVLALCQYHCLPEKFGIYQCENDIGILKRLNALIVKPDRPDAIGVVIDADNPDVAGRWLQIRQKIKIYNYSFPEIPDAGGTILCGDSAKPKIGIWLMPNNRNPGMLEDFLLEMANRDALAVALECVEQAKCKGATSFKPNHFSKAWIHTYLAWQDEPGKPLGQAVTAHSLEPDTEIANVFVRWLKELLEL